MYQLFKQSDSIKILKKKPREIAGRENHFSSRVPPSVRKGSVPGGTRQIEEAGHLTLCQKNNFILSRRPRVRQRFFVVVQHIK